MGECDRQANDVDPLGCLRLFEAYGVSDVGEAVGGAMPLVLLVLAPVPTHVLSFVRTTTVAGLVACFTCVRRLSIRLM